MGRILVASLRGGRRRLVGTSFAIVLGVAFLAATLVLADTLKAGFGDAFERANAGTDVVVRSDTRIGNDEAAEQRGLLDAGLVSRVADVPGVAAAVPQVEGRGQIVGSDGDPIGGGGPPVTAGGWIADPALNPYRLVEGRAPRAADEVVIDRGSARAGDLSVGARTTVLLPRPVPVTVVGVATFGARDGLGGSTYAAFTTERAQQLLLGRTDRITDILVRAGPDVSQDDLAGRVREILPPGAEAITGRELTAEQIRDVQGDFLDMFETLLLVFAGVALLVTVFSIHNTFAIMVAQRSRQAALMRAIGATRRQVLGAVAAEALVAGVVASAVGLAVGVGLATALAALLDATMGLPAGSAVLRADAAAISLSVGILVTLFASLGPALRASRVAPLAAMREVAVDREGSRMVRALLGVLLAGGGAALVLAGASGDGSIALAGAGAALTLAGFVTLGPVVARVATAAIGGPVAALRGRTGSLARRNAMRAPRRAAGAASALMIGIAVVTLFTVMAASITASVDRSVDRAFAGDLVIAGQDFSGPGLDPALAADVAALHEVAAAAGLGDAVVTIDGATVYPVVTDPRQLGAVLDIGVTDGSLDRLGSRGLAVEGDYARDRGWTVGSDVPVRFADGSTETMRVAAIYDDADLVGDLVMPAGAYTPHATQPSDDAVLVKLADGVSPERGRAAVEAVAERHMAPSPQDREEFIDTVAGQVDQMLAVVYGLLGLAILIALMGIANTLSLSIHERTRELGVLRAVGQTRGQMRAMVRWESVIVAVFGAIGGLALGAFLGWGLVKAAGGDELSVVSVPGGQLAVILLIAAGAGVLAAARPAHRAARLDVLRAVAAE
ncbi:MAG: ABC transporter permease [Thermoleophilia bacterium]